ncbi:ribonuclease H-like domain-containing protein [Tanacetum coccineum]
MAKEDEASKNHALVVNEVVPTEFALMAKSSSSSDNEVYDDSFCSKSCRKNTKNLNTKIIKLNEELSDCETNLYNYKRGLSQVEARLVEFKENEIKLCEKIRILERDIELKDNKIKYLRNELEEVKKEKESVDFKIENFRNASNDLDKLLGSKNLNKDKKGVGFDEYYVAPPPPIQVYSPPKQDLSWIGLHEFVNDTATDYTRPTPSINVSKGVSSELEGYNTSVFDQAGSSSNVMSKPMIKFVKGTGCSDVIKVNNTKSVRKPTMKYAEMAGTLHKVLESTLNVAQPKMTSFVKTSHSKGISQDNINDKGYWDSSCSRHMTGNISYLSDYEPFDEGYVSFGHGTGKITGKGSIKTGKLVFKNVHFVKELKYNLFSVSQICDNKNSVLFTDSECLVLGKDFKLADDKHVLLKTPIQQNMFTWTFLLKSKDETYRILRNFITEIENLKDLKVKIIRCDNKGEFKNKEMDEFCSRKGIKRV